jgi:small subunit ribosomal protein S9
MGAVVHGISRALASMNEEYKKAMSKQGMLTRDSRMVERKKPFLHKARKAPQYSKR